MFKGIRTRIALLPILAALALALFLGSAPRAHADPGQPEFLPVYTSPIDITGLRLQLRVAAPDRESGKLVDVVLPVDLLGPKMNTLFATPLSTQLDQYWSVERDPKTNLTQREQACDGKGGIKEQLTKLNSSDISVYDVVCNFAPTGQLLVKQVGSTLILAYQLTNNSISFALTTPGTCNANNGTFLCPNDPRFRVGFAAQIVTVVRTPSLCQLTAENGTVVTQAVTITGTNGVGALPLAIDELFLGRKVAVAEQAIEHAERETPLPLDASFRELRESGTCTGKDPATSRLLSAFREFETEIDLRQGIILRMSHAGIARPAVDAPNPGGAGATVPSQPSFTRPMIATTQPLVNAGASVEVSGQYFPANLNFATALPVTITHGGYGENSVILGGVCLGGVTELEWGPAGGQTRVQRLPGDAQGKCAPSYDATGLTPATAYQFRVRDCDPITCSPWSTLLKVTTAKTDANQGKVILTLDNGTALGTATVNALGKFETTITIPAGTAAGAHTIHAVNADAKADVALQVAAPTTSGRKASIMIVGLLTGETGCPNHPLTSTQTDAPFKLFGSGFAAGTVTIHLDATTGLSLGTATVRADGSICQQLAAVPGSQAGAHTLVAVQSGAVQAQTAVTFVQPSVVR